MNDLNVVDSFMHNLMRVVMRTKTIELLVLKENNFVKEFDFKLIQQTLSYEYVHTQHPYTYIHSHTHTTHTHTYNRIDDIRRLVQTVFR